jgi:hypothetical protein
MLRYFVQPVRKTALTTPPLYPLKAIPQRFRHGLGLGFAGQSRQIGSQFFGFVISYVQRHVSSHVKAFIHLTHFASTTLAWNFNPARPD